jgi:hypothetical protein
MPQDLTPPLPGDAGANAADAVTANLLNQQLGAVIESLGTANADTVAQLMDIASAITSSIVGGTTGVTANRLLRSKGTSGFALQNSVITCSDTGTLSDVERMLVGLSSVISLVGLDPLVQAAGSTAALAAMRFSNNVNPARLILTKSRSATVGTNTILQTDDVVGQITWLGANGTGYDSGAQIQALIDTTPGSSNDMPMRLEFLTTPDGSATPVLRFSVTSGGSTRFSYQAGFNRTSLTDASTIAWDARLNQSTYVLLTSGVGATRVLGAPTNLLSGFTYILVVQQSSTGSNALTYNSVFKWPGGVAPVLSTANNAIDVLTFISDGTNLYGVAQKGFA